MKDQYFGDINDYWKFCLIRDLSDGQKKVGFFWMLTPDDQSRNGGKTNYLEQPRKYRWLNPDIFDFLNKAIAEGDRRVSKLQGADLFPGSKFFAETIPDDPRSRALVVQNGLEYLKNVDLVFFDPDNGLQVRSRPIGSKGSQKYLYYSEVSRFYKSRLSILIFQHFPREGRASYIDRRAGELLHACPGAEIFSFSCPNICFFLVAQPECAEEFCNHGERIQKRWRTFVKFHHHLCDPNLDDKYPPLKYETWMGKELKEILIERAGKEAEEILAQKGFSSQMRGFCHALWPKQKEILWRKYKIEWKSPTELYPNILVD